ncbi:MAG: hypothetical protein AAFY71_11425 [Bacteroidota bacterium]
MSYSTTLEEALHMAGDTQEIGILTPKARLTTREQLTRYFNGDPIHLERADLLSIAKLCRKRAKSGRSVLPFTEMPELNEEDHSDPESSCW